MDEADLSGKWDDLLSSHFKDLKRDGDAMVTTDEVVDKALLEELDWSVSEAKFNELVQGERSTVVLRCTATSERSRVGQSTTKSPRLRATSLL